MSVFAVVNQKGGVGKTAVTLGLASATARQGATTLVVDLDPQSTATGVVEAKPVKNRNDSEVTMTNVMLAEAIISVKSISVPTSWGFDIAPSTITMAKSEQSRVAGGEYRLRESLEGHDYDVVLIDCSPSLGLLTENALAAADFVLIVASPSYAAMRGLRDLYFGDEMEVNGEMMHRRSTFEQIKALCNTGLNLGGVIANMTDETNDTKKHLQDLRELFGDLVWEPSIPRRNAMAVSNTTHVPLHEMNPSKGGALRLTLVLDELARRLLKTQSEVS